MTVQSTMGTELSDSVARAIESAPRGDVFTGRWPKLGRQKLVVFALLCSDVTLAFAMWQVARVLYGILGHTLPSGLTLASVVAVWAGLRAVLGAWGSWFWLPLPGMLRSGR